ncbi:hypothetical protein JCM19233_3390 [Vibrio astriarenae]|nr:hypothetical protein JCM19233_3390 [Vibrio sp. C7]
MPEPESILWRHLKGKQLKAKFRRQHSIARYIVDFYCPEKRLVIEIDGDSHYTANAQQKDVIRDQFLASKGIQVLRFTNEDVMVRLDDVLGVIWQVLNGAE